VLLGGQSPLVEGNQSNALQLSYQVPANPAIANATPDARLLTSGGTDVTALVNQGQLGALLSFRNTTLPSVIGDSSQQGSLNQLAQTVADTVNNLLEGGQISSGPPAVAGQALFSYSTPNPTEAASSLALAPSITASTLAAISPGPPAVANGIATQLASLSTAQNASLNNLTATDFYSSIASGIGQSEATASANQTTQAQLLSQAQNMRAQVEGVSLNQQATLLMQYQQSYQAAAQLISTVNITMQSLLTVMQDTNT
jgi:flagellar hook-associated protein 1 FlgK